MAFKLITLRLASTPRNTVLQSHGVYASLYLYGYHISVVFFNHATCLVRDVEVECFSFNNDGFGDRIDIVGVMDLTMGISNSGTFFPNVMPCCPVGNSRIE
jgi:hypothetical protein